MAADSRIQLMSRRDLTTRIGYIYEDCVSRIVERFRSAENVCLTADIWSSHRRSYLGVTCHWINDEFQREAAILTCQRFTGSHNYVTISQRLEGIMKTFHIPLNKVTHIVTDNADNFLKAFREFGLESCKESHLGISWDGSQGSAESENESGSDSDDDELTGMGDANVTPNDAEAILSAKTEVSFKLPAHMKCASHTLNLVVTADFSKVCFKCPIKYKAN